jgi:hypothetical protein
MVRQVRVTWLPSSATTAAWAKANTSRSPPCLPCLFGHVVRYVDLRCCSGWASRGRIQEKAEAAAPGLFVHAASGRRRECRVSGVGHLQGGEVPAPVELAPVHECRVVLLRDAPYRADDVVGDTAIPSGAGQGLRRANDGLVRLRAHGDRTAVRLRPGTPRLGSGERTRMKWTFVPSISVTKFGWTLIADSCARQSYPSRGVGGEFLSYGAADLRYRWWRLRHQELWAITTNTGSLGFAGAMSGCADPLRCRGGSCRGRSVAPGSC